jgi:hypothetical protein
MLDYAANGPWYWDAETLRKYAVETADKAGRSLDEELQQLNHESEGSSDGFFELIENNLREGQVRLVFFLEEAPPELKSVVDFLNRQMERSEVLIVEAQMFEHQDTRVVIPQLFGYTEQARRVKKTVTVRSGTRRKWTVDTFFEDARARLDAKQYESVSRLHELLSATSLELRTGSGKETGSISYSHPALGTPSILSLFSDGSIWLNFQNLAGNGQAERFGDELGRLIVDEAGLQLPDNYRNRSPAYKIEEWSPKCEVLAKVITKLLGEIVNK